MATTHDTIYIHHQEVRMTVDPKVEVVAALRSALEQNNEWRGSDGVLWKTVTLYAGEMFTTAGR